MGYSMINNTTLNKWELNFNPTDSGTRIVTLNTAGTFLDRNIDIAVTLDKISLTSEKTSGNLTVAPNLVRTEKPSNDTWVDAANGAATSTKPTSGPYVQIDAAANTNTVTIKGKVSTAGYGNTTNYTAAATAYTVGSAVATTKYIPIKTTNLSFTGGALNNKAATATFVNANNKVISTASTDSYNNGLSVQAKGTAGRAAVTYTNSAGWLDAHSSTSASGAIATSTWNGTTYYLTGVKIASPSSGIAKFDITVPNGNTTDFITFQFQVDAEGNVTVVGPD